MRVETHEEALLHGIASAFPEALDDTVDELRGQAPRRTGEYAESLTHSPVDDQGDRLTAAIGSPLPQAGAVERGANVGARRGPHMAGAHVLERAGASFGARMTRRLQESRG